MDKCHKFNNIYHIWVNTHSKSFDSKCQLFLLLCISISHFGFSYSNEFIFDATQSRINILFYKLVSMHCLPYFTRSTNEGLHDSLSKYNGLTLSILAASFHLPAHSSVKTFTRASFSCNFSWTFGVVMLSCKFKHIICKHLLNMKFYYNIFLFSFQVVNK